jgi:hypothetical protein
MGTVLKPRHDPLRPARIPGSVNDSSQVEFVYANEVASILGLERVEYRQIRCLLALVRGVKETELGARWARFSLADIAGLQIAIPLVGGPDGFRVGGRLRMAPLKRACEALRSIGIANPLIDVPLHLHDGRVVAQIEGIVVDPRSGQALLASMYDLMKDRVPRDGGRTDAIQRLRSELASLRTSSRVGNRTAEMLGVRPLPVEEESLDKAH